jgi:Raf kinase inhibitor-like YbhB/YbcL family protein
MGIKIIFLFLSILVLNSCTKKQEQTLTTKQETEPKKETTNMTLKITSTAFQNEGMIPEKYTCDGEDLSPALKFEAIPAGTKSTLLICDDPDAPSGNWNHWILYNIPPNITELDEGISIEKLKSKGILSGTNDFKKKEYGGPCPPGGTHRYFFKFYALDEMLNPEKLLSRNEILKEIAGHILAQAELMGKYKRK